MSHSEERIWKNRLRRRRELRVKIWKAFLSAGIIFFLSFTANVFLSNAKADVKNVDYKYYRSILIEAGDSLWSIAEENMGVEYIDSSVYVAEVKNINHLQDDNITAGNYLIIPYYSTEFLSEYE